MKSQRPFAIVVIGASLGGLAALKVVLGGLAPDFSLPIAIVQHGGAAPGGLLAHLLARQAAMPVQEVEDKQPIVSGRVYLAPTDYHLLVGSDQTFALSIDPPVAFARPSIDVLFETAADAYGQRAIGVILTGGGRDGPTGAARLAENGGVIIVQDPRGAEDRTLPEAVLAAVPTAQTAPLDAIPAILTALLR